MGRLLGLVAACGLAILCTTAPSWSATPLAKPQGTPQALTLEQECGLRSHRVFGGNLIGLESGPGFSGFVRELDGTMYGAYYGTRGSLLDSQIISYPILRDQQLTELGRPYGFDSAWRSGTPPRQQILLVARGVSCDLLVVMGWGAPDRSTNGVLDLLESIQPVNLNKSPK